MRSYTHMLKALYSNTIFELVIGIASSFSGMALNSFWKRALYNMVVTSVKNPLRKIMSSNGSSQTNDLQNLFLSLIPSLVSGK